MIQSIYTFERSEIRTMQNMCEGDNEKFLNMLADLVGKQSAELDELRTTVGMLEHTIRVAEQNGTL